MAKAKGDSVDVLSADGAVTRTYSKEVHGKDFAKLAEEFASKEEGRSLAD